MKPIRTPLFLFVSGCLLVGCSEAPHSDPADREPDAGAPASLTPPRFLTDDAGRALVLRGMNVDNHAKSDPLHAIVMSDAEIKMVAEEMGFNFVRYLVLWSGLEPMPGKYDVAYLDRIEADLDRFAKHGIWVLLDLHQDLYAARFGGDGAPPWAIRDDDLPFELKEPWSLNYFEPAAQRAFDNFWAYAQGEHADLQDRYVAMLRHLAQRFRDHRAVLGYDVMNEPHPGSDFDLNEVFNPRVDSAMSKSFDETELAPFYQRAIDAIREVDEENFVFFEPRYGAPGAGARSFLPTLVDPRRGEPRLAYAPHLYSVLFEAARSYSADDETLALWEERRTQDLARQPMPIVLGEWGFAFAFEGSARFTTELMEMTERMLLSWAQWSWDPGGPESWALYDRETDTLNPMFELVDRPYPQATAGEPIELHFDAKNDQLRYVWEEREGITSRVTDVFIPLARKGASTLVVELSDPRGSWSHEWDARVPGLLHVTASADHASHELRVSRRP